ncbi:peptidoglycan-binding protein [Kribbella sp. NPDC058245]|uniref:peptidoglycan-binding domain-containing protein n=1 Tax=Kribbella sp. NPDC058245 TaxID=3346399 RepID=UPI0036EB43A9
MDREQAEKSDAGPAPIRRPPDVQSSPAGFGDFQMLQDKAGNAAVNQLMGEPAGTPGKRPNLDVGDTGPAVRVLQQKLRTIGIECPLDGTFGSRTHEAVVEFQTHNPELHPATGGVGVGTWKALDSQTGQPAHQDAFPVNTTNESGETTSHDPLVQLETAVLAGTFGGKLPWYVWDPLRRIIRVSYTATTELAIGAKLIYDAVQFVESGEWEAAKAEGKSPLFKLLLNSHFPDTLLHIDVLTDLLGPDIAMSAGLFLNQFKHAGPTFQHYLHGGGADRRYVLQDFADEDVSFRQVVASRTPLDGSTQVVTDYTTDTGSSRDWHYTFGGVDHLSLRLIDGSNPSRAVVQVVLADPYQWHPNEIRADILMHKSMEILKQSGAREFMQRDDGSPVIVDLSRRR